jgi:hypothetical protein
MVGFDERRLLAAASAHLQVDEPLEAAFRPAFRALVTSLREQAQLSQVGAWRAGARLITALGQRVALAAVDLGAPIFITGLPRASTNLLHNLLARTPGLWAPRLWELRHPIPPARIDEAWIDHQIRNTEAFLDQLYEAVPEFRRLHPLAATSPEACSWLFRASFSSLIHAFHWYVPDYVEFMLGAELEPAYRDHRRFVRVLAHRHRHDDLAGPRIVLEDPWHMWQLETLLSVYPDARVIVVHGEREQVLESLARACWTLQQVDAKRPRTPAQIRSYCEAFLDAGLAAQAQARARLDGGRLIDVAHAELVADPLAVLRRLAPRLQLPVNTLGQGEAARWLANERALGERSAARPGAAKRATLRA